LPLYNRDFFLTVTSPLINLPDLANRRRNRNLGLEKFWHGLITNRLL